MIDDLIVGLLTPQLSSGWLDQLRVSLRPQASASGVLRCGVRLAEGVHDGFPPGDVWVVSVTTGSAVVEWAVPSYQLEWAISTVACGAAPVRDDLRGDGV